MGVTQGMKIEQRHIQLLVNDAIRMLQGARLDESAVLASVYKMDRFANSTQIAIFIHTDLTIVLNNISRGNYVVNGRTSDGIAPPLAKGSHTVMADSFRSSSVM
jgi:hypothetical protein